MRHSLSDESTRAATVLSSWATIPGLIPEADVIQVFKDKAKRSKKDIEEDNEETAATVDVDMDVN